MCAQNKFVKFFHNHDFSPSIESDKDGYDTARFLVFTQHIQYVKIKGLAFISDYQDKSIEPYVLYPFGEQDHHLGNLSLLTDPQNMTDP